MERRAGSAAWAASASPLATNGNSRLFINTECTTRSGQVANLRARLASALALRPALRREPAVSYVSGWEPFRDPRPAAEDQSRAVHKDWGRAGDRQAVRGYLHADTHGYPAAQPGESVNMVARLRAEVTPDQAQAELATVFDSFTSCAISAQASGCSWARSRWFFLIACATVAYRGQELGIRRTRTPSITVNMAVFAPVLKAARTLPRW